MLKLYLYFIAWLGVCLVTALVLNFALGTFMRQEYADGIASWFGVVLFFVGALRGGM